MKTSTSKKKRGPGRPAIGLKVKGVRKRFKRSYPGEDAKFDILPPEKPDIEQVLEEPQDQYSKMKYPPPKKHPLFRQKWARFIDNVTRRENFNVAHLDSLEILCDLHVEYDELQTFIRTKGRSYVSMGRNGEVWKFYPEVGHLSRCQALIKEYSKMLGLLLKKDHSIESDGEKEGWD
jgi:Phage terminase, small subunit